MRRGVVGHVLGKVGLDDRDAHLQQPPDLSLEPFDGVGVGEVDGGAWLGKAMDEGEAPTLPSPGGGGRIRLALQQETLLLSLGAYLGGRRHLAARRNADVGAEGAEPRS